MSAPLPVLQTVINLTVDTQTRQVKMRTAVCQNVKDILLASEEQQPFYFQTFECWMTEQEFAGSNNWPLWRTTCFREDITTGEKHKWFTIWYHQNQSIEQDAVQQPYYYSYDYYDKTKHATLGVSQEAEPQSIVVPKLIHLAKKQCEGNT